ncbi:MAG: hypothetical protein DWQ05_15305 [Calditrichaeota bacterium]|nr:MAG: hypothetical protein DWQ05_15305 [Calditrichota bacterium]
MAENRATLKSYFRKNSIPTEEQFAAFIDGVLNQQDDGIVKLPDNPLRLDAVNSASGEKEALGLFTDTASQTPEWTIKLDMQDDANSNNLRPGLTISDGEGNNRIFLDRSSGNLGIGTASADGKLVINGSASSKPAANPSFKIMGAGTESKLTMGLRYLGADAWMQSNGHLLLQPESGSVGIGVSSPLSPMHIKGSQIKEFKGVERGMLALSGEYSPEFYTPLDFLFKDNAKPTARIAAYHDGSGSKLVFGTSNSFNSGITNTALTINQIGNVGIGTDNPVTKLNVIGGAAFEGNNLYLRNRAAPAGNQTWGFVVSTSNGQLNLGQATDTPPDGGTLAKMPFIIKAGAPSSTFVIDESGKVGIGVAAPSAELHVKGRIYATQGAAIQQENWKTVPAASSSKSDRFQNSWINYNDTFNKAAYFKDSFGIVHLKGLVKNGIIRRAIFKLPSGYRPEKQELQIACTHPNVTGRIDIKTNGDVFVDAGSNLWISLDGITFKAFTSTSGNVILPPPIVVNPRG